MGVIHATGHQNTELFSSLDESERGQVKMGENIWSLTVAGTENVVLNSEDGTSLISNDVRYQESDISQSCYFSRK